MVDVRAVRPGMMKPNKDKPISRYKDKEHSKARGMERWAGPWACLLKAYGDDRRTEDKTRARKTEVGG